MLNLLKKEGGKMKTIIQEKTYGIETGNYKGHKRFFIVCDGERINTHFISAGLAMEQAEKYAKNIYKSFTRSIGNIPVVFSFKQMGVFNSYKKRAQVRINSGKYASVILN